MTKNTSAAQGFLASLLLLIAALVIFFVVLYPSDKAPETPAQPTATQLANESKRISMRQTGGSPASFDHTTIKAMGTGGGAAAPQGDAGAAGEPEVDQYLGQEGYDPDVEKAIGLIDAGNTTAAVALLEEVLKKDPKNEQALVELAMVHLLDLKQPEAATGYLQRVVEVNPGNQIVLSELVSLYEEQGKIDQGLAFMTDIFAKNPESPDLSYGIGQMLTLQGRDQDAIGYFEKATQSSSNQVRAYRDLGEAYSRSGDPDRAIGAYDQAIAADERDLQEKAGRGLPTQFAEERINYTKMDKARELIRKGELDQAQSLIDEVSKTMGGDESVMALQDTLNKKRAG